ncbi:hypothetical protein Moror_13114 [Moniliophthora roreri MCA 2997]|uniref:Uncharacterized protein n=1 Tax=Moniliophthora roreri (strain MCA 2997) TaxID=1381753 RepID=V2WQA3_MONRO|nr:hypothetical protein Moror_13114 [Moniliophthora roreri MCA 2997]
MMFFPTVSFTFLLVRVLCNAALSDSFPAAIIGTYNVTFVIVGVPSESAYSLVPAKYREVRAILPPDLAQFPALATEELPVFLELGREADAGPPFLSFESFQEAKIEVPNVKRVDNSSPFLYKRLIGKIANLVPIPASRYLFRRIAVTARTTIMLYRTCWMQLSGKYLKKKLDTLFPRIKASELEFAEYLICAQHSYDFTSLNETKCLAVGSVTLHPPYSGPEAATPVTFRGYAVRGVHTFKIVGPLPWSLFV